MNGVGVSSGHPSGPEVQLHKLCSHLVGRGAGGSDALVTSHYESALKLLTSPASHGRPGKEEEVALVERLVKSLARRGREREGAQVVALHQKLVSWGRDTFDFISFGSFCGVPIFIRSLLISGGLQPRHHQESSLYPFLARLSQ